MENPETPVRILVVDDEPDIRNILHILLSSRGYEVDEAENGLRAVECVRAQPDYDLIILDIMMPGMDGVAACTEIRQYSVAPILFLTAKAQPADMSDAYGSGGDDYLIKPFAYEELMARLRVLLRSPLQNKTSVLQVGDLTLHLDTHQVQRAGKDITLSSKEYALLSYMMQNAGTVLSRERLEQHIWNYDYSGGSNVIDVYIRYLRKKIDEGHDIRLIRTVRGAGYVLKADA